VVESAVVADETDDELVGWLRSVTGAHAIERVSHEDLKRRSAGTRAAVRTGEDTPYANVILVLGVAF
jgi:D-ribose pyranase